MAFDLGRFKKISERNKMIVFNYIRNIQAIFPSDDSYYHIHDLIKQTCALFYASIHEWDLNLISDHVEYIEATNSFKQVTINSSSSSFLKEKFNSGIHHWTFRCDKIQELDSWSSTIGIWNTKTRLTTDYPLRAAFTQFNRADEDPVVGYGFAYNIGILTDVSTEVLRKWKLWFHVE